MSFLFLNIRIKDINLMPRDRNKGAFKYYISVFWGGGVQAKMLTLLTLWRGFGGMAE